MVCFLADKDRISYTIAVTTLMCQTWVIYWKGEILFMIQLFFFRKSF